MLLQQSWHVHDDGKEDHKFTVTDYLQELQMQQNVQPSVELVTNNTTGGSLKIDNHSLEVTYSFNR